MSGKKIGIISCCIDDWGGSEELWARSIPLLQKEGVAITLIKNRINAKHPRIRSLANSGVQLVEIDPLLPVWQHRADKVRKLVQNKLFHKRILYPAALENFSTWLKTSQPDLMVIAQGINFDGLIYARECLRLNIPYMIIVQKAVDFYWPQPNDRHYMRACFQKAKGVFFVSRHNQRLTEEQFGFRFSNSMLIANPVKIPINPLPYPTTTAGYQLACVGRLFVLDKGQDMLLRILSRKVWKSRPVHVSFVGEGVDKAGLKAMAKLLEVTHIDFPGHISDIEGLWSHYHALILPSRSEGLPLSILEAMAAGRPVIVTDAGGNAEVVQDGVTGFVGGIGPAAFEEAMERAWETREYWPDMGKKASAYIGDMLSSNPEELFADCVKQIIYEENPFNISNYSDIQQG